MASGSDVALRAWSTPAGGPVSSHASLSCHIRALTWDSHIPCRWERVAPRVSSSSALIPATLGGHAPLWEHSATWSLFAAGGLQGGSEEKACWVTAPARRLEVCPAALDPPGGNGRRVVAIHRHGMSAVQCKLLCACAACVNGKLRGRKPCPLCSWEHCLGGGGGSHLLVVCPEVPRKGVPLGPWGCRDSGLPGDGCPVSA